MARLFVAAHPPPAVVAGLERLPRPPGPGVRWVPPGQWHVTLRFLGDADEGEVAAALDGLVAAPARATLGPAVSLLGRAVVCVPVAGVEDLAGAVARATAGLGEPPGPRAFAGHLTLGRLRHRGSCGLAGTPFSAAFDVVEVALVRSVLGRDGAAHHVVGRWPLGPGR